jgi:hypothetical protein
MGLLEGKLLEMAERDAEVAARMRPAVARPRGGEARVDLAQVDRRLVARAKAAIHAELAPPGPYRYLGARISIIDMQLAGDDLRVVVASDAPTDNPYIIRNPPLQVEPGVDDPAAALRVIIGEAVVAVAQSLGWRAGALWRP